MKRFLPALLGISLVLPACDQEYKPVVLEPDDSRLLSGRWAAELSETLEVFGVASGGGRLFILNGPSRLLWLDAQTGARLGQVTVPVDYTQGLGGNDLAYRSDGRLLVLSREQLLTYDPLTLTLLESRRVPVERQNGFRIADQLSPDGEVLYSAAEPFRQSTLTGQMLPTVSLPAGQTVRSRSSDDRWWLLEDRVVRASDGLRLETAPQHSAPPCPAVPASPDGAGPVTGIETGPPGEGEVLLGFGDGVVEVRNTRNQTVRSLRLTEDCLPVTSLRLHPDGQTVSFTLGRGEQLGTLDLASGQVTHRVLPDVPKHPDESLTVLPLPEGVFTHRATLVSAAFWSSSWSLEFRPWTGGEWNVMPQRRTLALDVQMARTSDQSAEVTGTATLDGRSLGVAGTLGTLDAVLAPQGRPFTPQIGLRLTLQEGTRATGWLNGQQAVPDLLPSGEPSPSPRAEPHYDVWWSEADTQQSFVGELRRP